MPQKVTKDKGFSLLELVVAVAVLAIGTLAAMRATEQSRHALAGAPGRLLATIVAQNRAEELHLYGAATGRGLPDRVEMGGQAFAVDVGFKQTAAGLTEAQISARAETGEGAQLVAILPSGNAGQ